MTSSHRDTSGFFGVGGISSDVRMPAQTSVDYAPKTSSHGSAAATSEKEYPEWTPKLDDSGRVVYPSWDDVKAKKLPRGICDVMPVNLVAKICFDGREADVKEAMYECSKLLAQHKRQHMNNISGPKKLMIFFTGRMISTAGECIGSSLASMVSFTHLINRILSQQRGLDYTKTFVTPTEYTITNIVLSGHTVPFDCETQIYQNHGHLYHPSPDDYIGQSCCMYRTMPDGTKEYIGTITPYKSNNIILAGVPDLEDSVDEALRQFSSHVGDSFQFDQPLGPLPEARVEDTGTKLEVFYGNL